MAEHSGPNSSFSAAAGPHLSRQLLVQPLQVLPDTDAEALLRVRKDFGKLERSTAVLPSCLAIADPVVDPHKAVVVLSDFCQQLLNLGQFDELSCQLDEGLVAGRFILHGIVDFDEAFSSFV